MVQIIQENRKPSFSEKIGLNNIMNNLGEGISHGLLNGQQERKKNLVDQRENEALRSFTEQLGLPDISHLPNNIQKTFIQEALKGKNKEKEFEMRMKLDQNKPKNPLGGLTGQAVPEEVSQAADQILQKFPNADADQLKMMMDKIGIPPIYSNSYVENRRRQDERMQTSKDKRLESGHKRAEKVLDKADALGQEIPLLESSVQAMEDAIVNGDQSFWSLDNLAEMTGLELFRTAKGGQFKTAAKNYFINDLKASGARPNQFIEKQLADALTKVGRSQEANQTVIESFKFSNDLKKKWQETARELEKYYEDSIGYLPGSFSRMIEDQMKPFVDDRQKQYEKRLRDLAAQEKNKSSKGSKKDQSQLSGRMVDVVGPDGQQYEVDESEVEMLPEGYLIK